MASENGREGAGLSDLLVREPYRFDFFQAVRLLERWLHERARQDPRWQRSPIGRDFPPEREVVRFRALPGLSFPGSAVVQVKTPASAKAGDGASPGPLEMVVSFLGLTGPNGVLPYHYTNLLIQRVRAKDFSLRDFLDLFHHRLISLFYRAWEKYRLPFAYERFQLDRKGQEEDLITRGLYCLVGLGTGGQRGRLEIHDEAFLFYSGHFAHFPRSAAGLESLLGDYFDVPIHVLQCQGQWLVLESPDQAMLPSPQERRGRNNELGVSLIVGERVWDVQSKFRLRVGPLNYRQFRGLMPNGDALKPLVQLTRSYVGTDLDFDVQPILKAAEVPWCRLVGNGDGDGYYLGWNTWVRCREFPRDVDDTVFTPDEG
ncbi:MAG: type VI secretion system baseplate subunit TssG [Planctomycetes bacterium]|nr:type VI secretion system baseplate subunit TssG [Planctomycetota bacterium]